MRNKITSIETFRKSSNSELENSVWYMNSNESWQPSLFL